MVVTVAALTLAFLRQVWMWTGHEYCLEICKTVNGAHIDLYHFMVILEMTNFATLLYGVIQVVFVYPVLCLLHQ
jgi:hypothetical protein